MKTVYVLGAGFSAEAGAPTQKKIISEAFRLQAQSHDHFRDQRMFMLFKEFLTSQLNIHDNNHKYVDLEDVFTPLDRCLSENSQFRGISIKQLSDVRKAAFYVIGQTIQSVISEAPPIARQYIDDFAEYLVNACEIRAHNQYRFADPVSVISTNWDALLDNALYQAIQQKQCDGVVDYCCYISAHDDDDSSLKPGLEVLGRGGFNIKILKPHGSLNWKQCPRCMRLYAKFTHDDLSSYWQNTESCRHCDDNFPEERGNHKLFANLIMPTFIKDLNNPQYKVIWQNAGIEIAEASELVFIGYSLPSADFEMRQLLSRMTRKNAKIRVVDFATDEQKRNVIQARWNQFFGEREITYYFDGATNYIENMIHNCS
ncbi:hypothetical protein LDJ79_09095 [Vibrio tritonius]|uniref:Uncharacterized protein n=1 Tax=Vibrio tritonius TaxID=1435069 RepID=A0ABS7YPB4_9VIBR|nr:hypothetical protein [Vibrio tritonius]MCA2016264.1 hypothetical protein [Vibrio tritonius]